MGCQRYCFAMCCVAHHAEDKKGVAMATNPHDGVPAIVNEPRVCGADKNCMNPFREVKHQRHLLNHNGALAGQETI